ncbi:MAG: hypothetical protein LLF93_03215 [Bacteroidales bacterium]|nr:hypothetical protein [Bacteroidales bacterium]
MSYANVQMYNAVIPSFDGDKSGKGGKPEFDSSKDANIPGNIHLKPDEEIEYE